MTLFLKLEKGTIDQNKNFERFLLKKASKGELFQFSLFLISLKKLVL